MIAITQFVSGDLDGAQQTLDEATTGWAPDRYLFTHVWLFYAKAPLALMRGDVEAAPGVGGALRRRPGSRGVAVRRRAAGQGGRVLVRCGRLISGEGACGDDAVGGCVLVV